MTKLYLGEKNIAAERHLFPCDCMDGDYLTIWWDTEDDDKNPEWRMLGVESGRCPHHYGWRKRLGDIWKLLRGQPIWVDDVILNVDVARELRDFIDSKLPDDYNVKAGDKVQFAKRPGDFTAEDVRAIRQPTSATYTPRAAAPEEQTPRPVPPAA